MRLMVLLHVAFAVGQAGGMLLGKERQHGTSLPALPPSSYFHRLHPSTRRLRCPCFLTCARTGQCAPLDASI